MKNVIGYCRISTADQSNFSISGQQEYILRHCQHNNWNLLHMYTDEGESAANFNRSEWKNLTDYIKKHHKSIDYLVVVKYDRFSRNLTEALAMINKLEMQYQIVVLSVMEPISLHPESPQFFQTRTQMLLFADVEHKMIRDRTKFGIVNAKRAGRFLGTAPYGYKNARDVQNKPIIVIDPQQSAIVKQIFAWYLQGFSLVEVLKAAKEIGFNRQGKSAIRRILENPVYTGMVNVPKYYDNPEDLVDGLHEALIQRSSWLQVQAMLNRKGFQRVVLNDDFPLRGVLQCHCTKLLTGANSKGRSRYYGYYKCETHKKNLSADKLHAQFNELLSHLSFGEEDIKKLQERFTEKVEKGLRDRRSNIKRYQLQVQEQQERIDQLEEKYINGDLNKDLFEKWHSKYKEELRNMQTMLAAADGPVNEVWKNYREKLNALADLRMHYNRATTTLKQAFVRLVFNNSLQYVDGSYRTAFILPIFRDKLLILNNLGLLKYQQPQLNSGVIPIGAPGGT